MYIAIDIGGTKTDIGLYKSRDMHSLEHVVSIPSHPTFAEAVQAICTTIQTQTDSRSVEGIGISFAGTVNDNGDILKAPNLSDYIGKPLRKQLEDVFHTSVFLLHDSVCSALAEYVYGDIKQYNRIIHLIMGTGFGGAFIEKRSDGMAIFPLQPGGMIMDVQSGRSHPFSKASGLLEAYVGGGSIADFYGKKLEMMDDNHVVWEEITTYLAAGINNMNCLLKPDVVVIAGGIGLKRKVALQSVVKKVTAFDEYREPPQIAFTTIDVNSSLLGAVAIHGEEKFLLHT